MPNDIVWIKTYSEPDAARRVGEMLRARGIESVVGADPGRALGLARPTVPGFRLGVRADDVRAALEVVWEHGD